MQKHRTLVGKVALLAALAILAVTVAAPTTAASSATIEREQDGAREQTDQRRLGTGRSFRFGRLFPSLDPLVLDDEVLLAIGSPSDDNLAPAFMEDSQFRGTDNNAEQEAGYTYVGQILAHDISLDLDSVIGEVNDPNRIRNRATPWLDLDTIYRHDGRLAALDPQDRAKLLLGNDLGNERNLLGRRPIEPERQIQWWRFFDFNSFQGDLDDDVDQFAGLQVGRKIDRFLARPMLRLPIGGPGLPEIIIDRTNTVAGRPVVSLANLTLFRGQALGLPSGQAVAAAMGFDPIPNSALGLCPPGTDCPVGDLPLTEDLDEAPLLLYVLEEARIERGGEALGPVGERVVADVVIGLLLAERKSVLNRPFVSPVTGTAEVTMEDMILHLGWVELP